jgi:hypothetical protein
MTRFSEEGVVLLPYGLPEIPKAAEGNRLRRQIEKGIPMPSGSIVTYDDAMIDALAMPWLQPGLMREQFASPRYKPTRAGMTATVTGIATMPLLQVNLFNPRALMKLSIPPADESGRVPIPWAPTDRRTDKKCVARMLVEVPTREELSERVLESERHILADQTRLADLCGREGVQEDLLGLVVHYKTPGIANRFAVTTIDGNSRVAAGRAAFRAWIEAEREQILDVVRSKKPRGKLSDLLDAMGSGVFPLDHEDVIGFRHLRTAIEKVATERSTDELLESGLYAVPNLFAMPLTLIIAFEPAEKTSTILDAADLMMRNLHHPRRSSTKWDQSAGHAELRDDIVAKLFDEDELDEGEALLVGPRYEEAAKRHDMSGEPDVRAMAILDLVNGHHDRGRRARAILAEATGDPKEKRAERARLIVAALSEQLDSAQAKVRQDFETTLQDVLDTRLFGSVTLTREDDGDEPQELVEAAQRDREDGIKIEDSDALWELGIRGGIALAALGHLRRVYGQLASDVARPYQVLENMLADELGIELLGEAIEVWRSDGRLPQYDIETRKVEKGAGALRPTTLAAMFGEDAKPPAQPSATDLCARLRTIFDSKFMPTYQELRNLPEVAEEGVPPEAGTEVLGGLEPVRKRIELDIEKFRDFHGDPNDGLRE